MALVMCAALVYLTQTEAAPIAKDLLHTTVFSKSQTSSHSSLAATNLSKKVTTTKKTSKSNNILNSSAVQLEEQAKPKSILKKRTKRWNANLVALTLFDRSPEIKRPLKVSRARQTMWAYDFGGGVWGRRKRDIEDLNYDFEF